MYLYEINKLIIIVFRELKVYFGCQLGGCNSYFIFHNKQILSTQGYMLNVYVLVHFRLGLLYPWVATK
jgi:hypothetical protein